MATTERVIPEWPPPPEHPTFGQRLRLARDHAGLKPEDMAKALGATLRAIRSWETDQRQPRNLVPTVRRWAEITGVDEAWLAGLVTRRQPARRRLRRITKIKSAQAVA